MMPLYYFVLTLTLLERSNLGRSQFLHPNAGLTLAQRVKKYAYPLEMHPNIQTQDGYILHLHRIPHGKFNSTSKLGPVLLYHSIHGTAADWLIQGPDKSLAYILADSGYDVWLGNVRGSTWSRKHVSLDPEKDAKKFWDFSFHEIGLYDVSVCIDYILAQTKQKKLFYIGHSSGTIQLFILLSEMPMYNRKIQLMVALSPFAYLNTTKNRSYRFLRNNTERMEEFFESMNMYSLPMHSPIYTLIGLTACADNSPLQIYCAQWVSFLSGFRDSPQFNRTLLPVLFTTMPGGSSIKQAIYVGQLTKSGRFHRYDHGKAENLRRYGEAKAADYNLRAITAPVALFHSENDAGSQVEDVIRIYKELPKSERYLVNNKLFNYMDFLAATDVVKLLYNDVVNTMKRYSIL